MSNTSLQALNTLLERAEAERNEALALLRQAQDRADAAQHQAEQLQAYRGDYQKRWSQQFSQRGAIEIVHCYQGFNDRLEQALSLQQRNATQAAAQLERARALVQEREMRVASVRKLIERRQAEARRAEGRRDQRLTDEAAQRSGWNSTLPSRMVDQFI